VCLGAHCNIGSKRPCCPLASDVEPSHVVSTVHLWRRGVCRRSRVDIVVINCCGLCCTKGYLSPTVYTIRSVQVVKSQKFGLFRGLMAPKPYVPHHNSRTKGTFLGCRLALEMIPIAHNCAVSAVALSQTPNPRVPYFWLFRDAENPCSEIGKFFTGVRMRKAIHVCCFKNGRNLCRISGRKAALH